MEKAATMSLLVHEEVDMSDKAIVGNPDIRWLTVGDEVDYGRSSRSMEPKCCCA